MIIIDQKVNMWLDDFDNPGGEASCNAKNTTGTTETFFGQTIQMVEFYGVLRCQVIYSTKIIYEIEDVSDKIICHLWLHHEPNERSKIPDLMLNTYCRVVGTLKSLPEGRHVMVLKIRRMQDPNEMVTFMLSAVCARYEIEKHAKAKIAANGCKTINQKPDTDYDPNNKIGSALQYKVFKAVENLNNEMHGGALQQLIHEVGECSQKEFMDALQFLIDEGLVYATIDDGHYKVVI